MKIAHWHRRHAPTVASRLSDDASDAFVVIEAAGEIVEAFVMPVDAIADSLAVNVVAFRRGDRSAERRD
jgi:hypothetical protein